jgi:hypothetical protein
MRSEQDIDRVRIRMAKSAPGASARAQNAIQALRGAADVRMSTAEIMALTRPKGRNTRKSK